MTDKPSSTSDELNSLDPAPIAAVPASAADTTTSPVHDTPPPKPPLPVSPRSQAKATLIEAFPNVDEGVVEAVLVASGWDVEPAFNALLGIILDGGPTLTHILFRHDRSYVQTRIRRYCSSTGHVP